MEPQFIVPLELLLMWLVVIIAIAYTIKAVIDARVRIKLIASNPTDTLVQALLVEERKQRRQAALRWGVVLPFLAAGFVLLELIGWTRATPGPIGVLVGATGLGNLAFLVLERAWADKASGAPGAR